MTVRKENKVIFQLAGDSAVNVVFGDVINPEINNRVQKFYRFLETHPPRGYVECVPAYCSALVCYSQAFTNYKRIVRELRRAADCVTNGTWGADAENDYNDAGAENTTAGVYIIPVCYGGIYGEDFPDVCAHTGLAPDEVIRRHSGVDYLIYMLGFLPGFAYLGGLDPSLATPRLPTPRVKIPAGSVGIGGAQTGAYPVESPGGWRLIGRTHIMLYDPRRIPPIPYRAGDRIRFKPIDENEYRRIEADNANIK